MLVVEPTVLVLLVLAMQMVGRVSQQQQQKAPHTRILQLPAAGSGPASPTQQQQQMMQQMALICMQWSLHRQLGARAQQQSDAVHQQRVARQQHQQQQQAGLA